MSNNLVSQSMPSMQMAQMEPILNRVDSTGRQMEVGHMGHLSNDPMSLQQEASNEHAGLLGVMPGEPRSQGFPKSSMQSGQGEMHRSNMGMHQLFIPNRQSMQMGTMTNSMGPPQQLSSTPKRKAPMEQSSGSSMTSTKRVAQMENRPWLQQASTNTPSRGSNASKQQHSATNKRKTQMESTSNKSGTSRASNSKNQSAQMKQPSKVQSESSESVRSKMRESLAAALALVPQQDKPQVTNNNTLNDAANTQGKLENSSLCVESASASIDTAVGQIPEISQSVDSCSAATGSVDHVMGELRKSTTSNEDISEKCMDFEAGSTNESHNEHILNSMEVLNYDKPDFQANYTLTTDDVPFSDSFFVKDELLQGNGLSWVISDMVDLENGREIQTYTEQRLEPEETDGGCKELALSPEPLASRIEAELFKLFGGVNKKYKEKGRSLLFNLKDRNNPELRERVMSGEIPPEQLCSMTAEELASKELSQWRIAKAEEFAQMVVLPDSDVDIRRLVKKTHKGEFQVEVDHEDNVSVEVSGGTRSVTESQTTKNDAEAYSASKPDVIKGDVSTHGEKRNLQKDKLFSITISSGDGTDPMQGLMTDDALKDPDFLPPIVSLDEFMESLHSEPPFENLPEESGKVIPVSKKDDCEAGSKSKSSDLSPSEQVGISPNKPEKRVDPVAIEEKRNSAESAVLPSDTRCSESNNRSVDDLKITSRDAELRASQSHAEERYGNNNAYTKTAVPTKGECVWEGMLQLNISATHSVISFFKSGEKTSAKDWPGFLEIKGRVRLEAFEKFLQELPLSRSRAIMVVHFVSKVSSPSESTLREVSDSYILDERVGFAEPVHGVELYFCPPHKKSVEMLSKILPKEQIEAVNSIDNGLIGVIVWRKTNLTSTISPTSSSHHKHSSKRQNFSRRQQDTNVNDNNTTHKAVPSMGVKNTETGPSSGDDDDDDDIPPGFGPPPVAARGEDDLPEFKFSGGSNASSHLIQKPMAPPSMVAPLHSVNHTPSRPVEQMRELVHKYGQNQRANVSSVNWQDKLGVTVQPWIDDDDDIPEWRPQTSQIPPQQTMHNFHLRPHIMNQQPFAGTPQQPILPTQQYLQPPMNVTHGQRNLAPPWGPSNPVNNLRPSGGHPYAAPVQNTWPQNVSRSRGF